MADEPLRTGAYDAQGRYIPGPGDFEPNGAPRSVRSARTGNRAIGFYGFGAGDLLGASTPPPSQPGGSSQNQDNGAAALRGVFADRSNGGGGDGSNPAGIEGPTTNDISDLAAIGLGPIGATLGVMGNMAMGVNPTAKDLSLPSIVGRLTGLTNPNTTTPTAPPSEEDIQKVTGIPELGMEQQTAPPSEEDIATVTGVPELGMVDQTTDPTSQGTESTGSNDNAGPNGSGGQGGEGDGASGGPGGASGGDAAGCFVAGTPVLMADGSYKLIEDIRIGDAVASFNGRGPLNVGKVVATQSVKRAGLMRLNGIVCSDNHPFLTEDVEYKQARTFAPGDKLVLADGQLVDVTDAAKIPDEAAVYNFTVEPSHTYVAGGYRVHNIKARGGVIFNRRPGDRVPGPDDTRITAQRNEFVVAKPSIAMLGGGSLDGGNQLLSVLNQALLQGDAQTAQRVLAIMARNVQMRPAPAPMPPAPMGRAPMPAAPPMQAPGRPQTGIPTGGARPLAAPTGPAGYARGGVIGRGMKAMPMRPTLSSRPAPGTPQHLQRIMGGGDALRTIKAPRYR